MDKNSCAFTGHRPHKFPWKNNEDDPRCVALKKVLAEQVEKLVGTGITYFYSGMADGTDVWLSQIVLDLRKENPALKLHCFLPCEGQADKWSEPAQKRYYSILDHASPPGLFYLVGLVWVLNFFLTLPGHIKLFLPDLF